jgi:hypothetical protein
MTYEEAVQFYGSPRSVGAVLGVSGSRISQRKAAGGFSYQAQCVLEKESGGKLIARREDDPAHADRSESLSHAS